MTIGRRWRFEWQNMFVPVGRIQSPRGEDCAASVNHMIGHLSAIMYRPMPAKFFDIVPGWSRSEPAMQNMVRPALIARDSHARLAAVRAQVVPAYRLQNLTFEDSFT